MRASRLSGKERPWLGDLRVVLVALPAILLASQLADGTLRLVLMIAIALSGGLLMRLSRSIYYRHRGKDRRPGHHA